MPSARVPALLKLGVSPLFFKVGLAKISQLHACFRYVAQLLC